MRAFYIARFKIPCLILKKKGCQTRTQLTVSADRIIFLKRNENFISVDANKIAAGLTIESVTCPNDDGLHLKMDLIQQTEASFNLVHDSNYVTNSKTLCLKCGMLYKRSSVDAKCERLLVNLCVKIQELSGLLVFYFDDIFYVDVFHCQRLKPYTGWHGETSTP